MRQLYTKAIALFLFGNCAIYGDASSRAENRYSFSLTTFDPSGKLGQVDRAVEAASLGPPLVLVALQDRVLLAAPQHLPSPFMLDDGTPRFTQITPEIIITQTGLSADGRALCRAAQNIALNYRYTFDEDIPVDNFLQELSLLFQEYTMKPGCRPFGSTIIVAHVPSKMYGAAAGRPQLFQVNSSGSMVALEDCCVINGRGHEDLKALKKQLEEDSAAAGGGDDENNKRILFEWLQADLASQAKKNRVEESSSRPGTILTASFDGHLSQIRYKNK